MQPGAARAISNWVPAPWADPSLNVMKSKITLGALALLECFLLGCFGKALSIN